VTSALHAERLAAVEEALERSGARRVADLGCGQGDLLLRLAQNSRLSRLIGLDSSRTALERLRERLREREITARISLVHASMLELSAIEDDIDCAVLLETIEHLPSGDLSRLERAVFLTMRPQTVIITTPNAEFNPLLGVPDHRFRHPDHHFEWNRARFRRWAEGVGARNGYRVICSPIAGAHPRLGGASQMAVFSQAPGRERPTSGPPCSRAAPPRNGRPNRR